MNDYVRLARSAIEEYVAAGKIISVPKNLPPEFYEKKRGIFVSLFKGRELRGCIGTYLPVHKNLAEEIITNAIAACSSDLRFPPVTANEFSELSVEVSLLSRPELISSTGELDPQKFGVIIKCPDGRCGLLLPGLEEVDSAEEQLSIACQKGGINPMRDKDARIYKFSTEKYSQ